MNRTVGNLALLLLCGCSDNVEKDLAACKLEAIQIYKPGVSELKWDEPTLSFIGLCMTAAGHVRVDSQTRPCLQIRRLSLAGVRGIGGDLRAWASVGAPSMMLQASGAELQREFLQSLRVCFALGRKAHNEVGQGSPRCLLVEEAPAGRQNFPSLVKRGLKYCCRVAASTVSKGMDHPVRAVVEVSLSPNTIIIPNKKPNRHTPGIAQLSACRTAKLKAASVRNLLAQGRCWQSGS